MDALTLKDIIDIGTSGMLLLFVYMLWQRLNVVTDKIFSYLQEGAAEREVIAKELGLTTQQLTIASEVVRRRMSVESRDQP